MNLTSKNQIFNHFQLHIKPSSTQSSNTTNNTKI